MFYAHFVLSKKGPLARIWLAAHWDKKLSKAQIFETSIEGSVEAIMQPQVKLALRTSGHLLLGVVRIYSRKAKYLLDDCNTAIVKIKMAFRPGAVDLPEEGREAAVTAVTLPENFYEFDTFLPAMPNFDLQSRFSVHQSQPEEITLREDCRIAPFVLDDGFGDIGFDDIVLPEAHNELQLYAGSVREPNAADVSLLSLSPSESSSSGDGGGGGGNVEAREEEVPMELDAADIVKSPEPSRLLSTTILNAAPANDDADDVYDYGGFGADESMNITNEFGGRMDPQLFGEVVDNELFADPPTPAPPAAQQDAAAVTAASAAPVVTDQTRDQTTIINNDAEAFALGPIDATTIGTGRKTKKKRKLVIDEQKLIASDTMRAQLHRAADLVIPLELAPPTKRLMEWKDVGGVDKLLILPGKRIRPTRLQQLFNRGLVTRSVTDKEEAESRLKRKEQDVETECGAAMQLQQQQNELRRGASLPDGEVGAGDLSRMSTAPVAVDNVSGIQLPGDDAPPVPADVSRVTVGVDVSAVADISLPPMPDVPMTAPIDDLSFHAAGTSIMDPTSVATLAADEFGDETAFNETLQSAAADITLFADGDNEEDTRILNRRSGQLLSAVQKSLSKRDDVAFSELIRRNHRKQVAAKFHTLLVLKKLCAIDVEQKDCFAKISITRGPAFDNVILQ